MKYMLMTLTVLASCSSITVPEPRQELKAETFYQRDMVLTVNGVTEEGTVVVPAAERYDFSVQARGDLSTFVMTTCHKEEKKESAWNSTKSVRSGLFGWGRKKIEVKNEVSFSYLPNQGIEDDGNCPMELRAVEKGAGRHSWAFVDFEGPLFQLRAASLCNGRRIEANGVAVCQSRSGLKQRMEFPEEVHPASNKCGFDADAKSYEYGLRPGICVAVFLGKESRKKFKLTTLGYEDILIRE
jgi:hypothetical protein